jgi:hypothetical protein
MDAEYFRGMAARCASAARNCFDLAAAAELNRLADEFRSKADELSRGPITQHKQRASNSHNLD